MKFFLGYLKGILIGAGAILPGISSGVFCVIFGIYEKLVDSVLNLFHNFKSNIVFLLPIVLGGITGVLLVSKLLNFLITSYPVPTKFCFIGLILGSIPMLFKKANNNKGFRLHYLIFLLATFFIGILSLKLENMIPIFGSFETSGTYIVYLTLAGFAMSVGIVVPGVSNTVILMIMGVYSTYLDAVSSLNFSILIPMGIGVILGSFLFLKLIQFLLEYYYTPTFYCIIGFVLGSVFVLYPGIIFNMEGFFSIFLLALGFFIGLKFEKLEM